MWRTECRKFPVKMSFWEFKCECSILPQKGSYIWENGIFPTLFTCSFADSRDGDGNQKKRVCCHGGLPWWFIFVGWLLVIATSFVSGYFTMLYGLKFGKERSISWLISMNVSFFQSIFVIQPLKVRRSTCCFSSSWKYLTSTIMCSKWLDFIVFS